MSHPLSHKAFYHGLALVTIGVWGTTFVSTKVLLLSGLNPASIFFYRFLLAYLLMIAIEQGIRFKNRRHRHRLGLNETSPKSGTSEREALQTLDAPHAANAPLFAHNLKDELKAAALGMGGGSVYFLTENTALRHTLSTQVSFILCTTPLITAILIGLFSKNLKKTFTPTFIIGTLLSLGGVAMVVFNGQFVLKLSPLGDFLCLSAALCWGFYTLLLKDMEKRYSTRFLTRKIFAYGLLTILPCFLCTPLHTSPEILLKPVVLGNLLFLGIVASMICYLTWNKAVRELGALSVTPYIYLSPIFTSIASAFILHEPMGLFGIAGVLCIIIGVYGAASGFTFGLRKRN